MTVDLDDFVGAWEWLSNHPYFFRWASEPRFANDPGFHESLSTFVWRDDKGPLVALEVGPWLPPGDGGRRSEAAHAVDLDVAAPTFEEAVIALAAKVHAAHGDYPPYLLCSHCLWRLPADSADANPSEWFCRAECAALGPIGIRTEPTEDGSLIRYIPPEEYCRCDRHGSVGE